MTLIAHGIDLVDITRIERMREDHGDRFLERVFTANERAYAIAGGAQSTQRLSARFAAKEAVLKALGTGMTTGMAWTDIEVFTLATGAPSLVLTGGAAAAAHAIGISHWMISLTHTGGFAMASVMGLSTHAPA
ncbi:MAG: holo-[acyl-carrier-protein] synthase [Phycisphaerales bacterium]|nr:holo-[acyl-carrier-protein] synthase [Phycisphaerales bacterium]